MSEFRFSHDALFFTQAQIDAAIAQREAEPFAAAFARLREHPGSGSDTVLLNAFRARFLGDRLAGEAAATALPNLINGSPAFSSVEEAVGEGIMLAQTLEMLHEQPDTYNPIRALIPAYRAWVTAILHDERPRTPIDDLSLLSLRLAAGIVLEEQTWVVDVIARFRQMIAETVRPQGFLHDAVKGEDGGSMARSVRASAALVSMAEMAAHVGVDLWNYEVRGVSVMTAAIFPMYYYYTTKRWKWDKGIEPEQVQALYRRYGGYLEMVYRRNPANRDILTVLGDLRPVYTPYAGGLTTLSHAPAPVEKKRRTLGLFG